jgi:hypothetical protein
MRQYVKRKKAAMVAETPPLTVDIIRPGRQGGIRTRNDAGLDSPYGDYGHINWSQFDLNTGQRGRLLRTEPMD